jgi:hypothetical protein
MPEIAEATTAVAQEAVQAPEPALEPKESQSKLQRRIAKLFRRHAEREGELLAENQALRKDRSELAAENEQLKNALQTCATIIAKYKSWARARGGR